MSSQQQSTHSRTRRAAAIHVLHLREHPRRGDRAPARLKPNSPLRRPSSSRVSHASWRRVASERRSRERFSSPNQGVCQDRGPQVCGVHPSCGFCGAHRPRSARPANDQAGGRRASGSASAPPLPPERPGRRCASRSSAEGDCVACRAPLHPGLRLELDRVRSLVKRLRRLAARLRLL